MREGGILSALGNGLAGGCGEGETLMESALGGVAQSRRRDPVERRSRGKGEAVRYREDAAKDRAEIGLETEKSESWVAHVRVGVGVVDGRLVVEKEKGGEVAGLCEHFA